MRLAEFTIEKIQSGLRQREFSAAELAKAALAAIEDKNGELHAVLAPLALQALAAARTVDDKIAAGEDPGSLAGVPVAIKDNILVAEARATAGSKILENYIAPYDATAVAKLKAAGAVLVAKTNLDEFAMGSSTENSAFGPTRNPVDPERVPGGSSGGSAAAVASGMCLAALGSDTGGSVRQPAAFTGIVGFKPTYGSVSRHGLIAMASSLDVIGPLTRTVADARAVYDVIRGVDEFDATSHNNNPKPKSGLNGLKIGVSKEHFIEGLDPDVEKTIRQAIEHLTTLGADIVDVSLPHTEYAIAAYYIVMPAEASSNLARFDGIRYGLSEHGSGLLETYLQSRGRGFGPEPRRRIMLGTYVLSAGYYEAYYRKAMQARTLIRQDFSKAFEQVDVIVSPTSPSVAFKLGEKNADPLQMYLEDIFTVPANLAGIPAISVPCPRGAVESRSAGAVSGHELPVGLQFMGSFGADDLLLDIAAAYQASYGRSRNSF
ncbi:Asp-tRNA(Asn)/Glu-tRNA(Gln) amidotransferase subunit GatA [Candidatus Parcubacteria bacterium]|nr:Asp-tRNA(Asn)/Glu-tRNA(Gln) amidotransferase subunit GatA [Candidatus Parcubacteria bacterium]